MNRPDSEQSVEEVLNDQPDETGKALLTGEPEIDEPIDRVDAPGEGSPAAAEHPDREVVVEEQRPEVQEAIEAVRSEPEREDVDNVGRPLGGSSAA